MFLFWLTKQYMFKEQAEENAHHEAITDQRGDCVRKELKKLLGDDGDHRTEEDREPYSEIFSSFNLPLS